MQQFVVRIWVGVGYFFEKTYYPMNIRNNE